MWGRIYEGYIATFSKALMKSGYVQDQNEHDRMNENVLELLCVTFVV